MYLADDQGNQRAVSGSPRMARPRSGCSTPPASWPGARR